MLTIHRSPLPDVELPVSAVTPYVFRRSAELSDKTVLIDGPTGRRVGFGELADLTERVAGGLAARGLGPGDVLGILAPNMPEYAVVFHAVATVGATITTINPTYTYEEVRYQINDAGARFLVTIPLFLDTAIEACKESGVEEIFVFGDAAGATPFTALVGDERASQVDVDPLTDVVVMPYSSGTTGLPKGVMLTHHNLTSNLAQFGSILGQQEDDVIMAVLPFFHIYGMQVLMNGVLSKGASAVLMPRFDLEEFLRLIQEHRVTMAYLVPPIVLALAKHPLVEQYDLASLRHVFSGAAPLGAEVAEEAASRIEAQVVQGYGLTETSPVTHATPEGDTRPGSIGVAVPNTEVRVVDPETGQDLDVGEDGEIWIRGPQVMQGYLNNPEATRNSIDEDGWFRTGDIGHVDHNNHYYIVDRLKELIKYKGFQVPPAELEALLLTHPAVADAAVIPVPDEEAGEVPKAFVVLKPEQEATADELMTHVAGHVATFKQIRFLEFIDAIPKSASGKILRRELRAREAAAG